jgi:UDP-glucose 4-epimerase
MRVLVTGGKGFIGSWVVQELGDRGIEAVVFDLPGKPFVLPWVAPLAEVIEGDVASFDPVAGALAKNVQAVIHAAALTNLEKAQSDPGETIRINNLGTVQVLEGSRKMGIQRVIYASSRGVLGHIDDEHGHPLYRPVDESYRIRPHTIYGASKSLSECLGQNYTRMYGLEFCSLRFSMIYGPGKRPTHGSGAFHSVLIEESLAGRPVTVPRGGEQKDDLI